MIPRSRQLLERVDGPVFTQALGVLPPLIVSRHEENRVRRLGGPMPHETRSDSRDSTGAFRPLSATTLAARG